MKKQILLLMLCAIVNTSPIKTMNKPKKIGSSILTYKPNEGSLIFRVKTKIGNKRTKLCGGGGEYLKNWLVKTPKNEKAGLFFKPPTKQCIEFSKNKEQIDEIGKLFFQTGQKYSQLFDISPTFSKFVNTLFCFQNEKPETLKVCFYNNAEPSYIGPKNLEDSFVEDSKQIVDVLRSAIFPKEE